MRAAAATRAMAAWRAAFVSCPRQDASEWRSIAWLTAPLDIGDEALFIGAQRSVGTVATSGHHRGLAMRQGRAVLIYLDCNTMLEPPTVAEIDFTVKEARTVAAKLANEPWTKAP